MYETDTAKTVRNSAKWEWPACKCRAQVYTNVKSCILVMLRPRHSASRPWAYIVGSFIAGAIIAYLLIPAGRDRGLSWQELSKQRELISQQSLTKGSIDYVSKGARKKLAAVIGVQVLPTASIRLKIIGWLPNSAFILSEMQSGFQRANAPQAYNYQMRREALRKTWFPESQAAADEYVNSVTSLLRILLGTRDIHQAELDIGS